MVIFIQHKGNYSEWTKRDFNVTLKKFYKWLKGNGEFPSEVKWLSTKPNKSKLKLTGQDGLLTEDDIKTLIAASDHPRNKSLISLLYESGCRIGEIASLNRNISEVEWLVPKSQNRIDVVFNLNGKKIGIEVQNSTLEYARLQEKIDLLDKHFDRWFLIVPKQFVKKYDYFSNSKGKVLSKNDAVKEITEILGKKEDFLKKAK